MRMHRSRACHAVGTVDRGAYEMIYEWSIYSVR